MKSLLTFSFITIFILNLHFTSSTSDIPRIIAKVIDEVRPRRVTLFVTDSNFTKRHYDLIFKNLIERVPTVTINIRNPPTHLNRTEGCFQYNNKSIFSTFAFYFTRRKENRVAFKTTESVTLFY